VSDLDIDHPKRSQRVEPGCIFREERLIPNDRAISFTEPGYLVTKGITLGTNSTFAFNLRTKSANAVLLYQTGKIQRRQRRDAEDSESFIAAYLYEGRLIIQLGTSDQRTKRTSLTSNQSYNDGFVHSVFLSRIGSNVQVRIDDREVLAAALDDERLIGSSESSLVFGGIPSHYRFDNQNNDLGTTEALVGCLTDFYYNYERFTIIPEEHHANLGSCQYDEISVPESEEPLTEEQQQKQFDRKNSKQSLMLAAPTLSSRDSSLGSSWQTCEADNALSGNFTESEDGVRFGVSESSHSRINFEKPYPDFADFKLAMSFRTRQKNSMLWVWANYKNYTRYFYLNIENGFLTLEARGHRQPKTLVYKGKRIDDNEWHSITLTKKDRDIHLQVDDLPVETMKDAPNPKVMRKRMFIGGVISKHRKQFNLTLAGFAGCIKGFNVDEVEHSLLSANRDVVPCVRQRNVAYIHDGGYALFDPLRNHKTEQVGSQVEVALSFRSTHPDSALLFALLYATDNAYENARLTVSLQNSSVFSN
jgi:hypothetical protein